MNFNRYFAFILASFFFTGCAFIHSLDENLPQQVNDWMQNKEYAKVINTLAYIHSDHPYYKKLSPLREVAVQKALEYETRILIQGKELLDKQQWQKAYSIYEQGLQKLPDSAAIQQAMDEFIQQRDTYIRQLSYQILFNRTQAILANTPIHNQISKAAPDNYQYRSQARQYEAERFELTAELLDCSEYSLLASQLVTSQKCLDLAGKLSGSPLSDRHKKLQILLSKKRKSLSQMLSSAAQINISAAEEYLDKKQLKQALEFLKKIPKEEQQKPAVIKLRDKLNKEIKHSVKQGAATGRQLYSEGKIKAALEIWQALLILDPENIALQKHIERAQRVMKKLESLSGSKAPVK